MRRLFRLWRLMAQDLGELRRMLGRADRPAWLLPAVIALAFFALEPLNFAIPGLGLLDDFILLPLLLRGLMAMAGGARAGGARAGRASAGRVVSIQ